MGAHLARQKFAFRDVGLKDVCAEYEGGDVKRNYLFLGIALLGMSVAVLAQDPPAKTAPKKAAAGKGSATKGKEVFDQKCGICHFADSDAKKIGPGLKGISKRGTFTVNNNKFTDESLKTWIENGDSLMPPFKEVLDEQQIKDVIAYVRTL
jgi:cytochrome c